MNHTRMAPWMSDLPGLHGFEYRQPRADSAHNSWEYFDSKPTGSDSPVITQCPLVENDYELSRWLSSDTSTSGPTHPRRLTNEIAPEPRPRASYVQRFEWTSRNHGIRGTNDQSWFQAMAGRSSHRVDVSIRQPRPSYQLVTGSARPSLRTTAMTNNISRVHSTLPRRSSAMGTRTASRSRGLPDHMLEAAVIPRPARSQSMNQGALAQQDQRLQHLHDSNCRFLQLQSLCHQVKTAVSKSETMQPRDQSHTYSRTRRLLQIRKYIQEAQLILRHSQAVVEICPTFRSVGLLTDPAFDDLETQLKILLNLVENLTCQKGFLQESEIGVPPELKAAITQIAWAEVRGVDRSRPIWEQRQEVEDNTRRLRKTKSFLTGQHPRDPMVVKKEPLPATDPIAISAQKEVRNRR